MPARRSTRSTRGASNTAKPAPPRPIKGRRKANPAPIEEHEDNDEEEVEGADNGGGPAVRGSSRKAKISSRFPGLEFEDFQDHLDDWTTTSLQEAIFKQASHRTRAPGEIKALLKTLRLEYEKRILMVALMADLPEIVVWHLVGEGAKKAHANPWIRFLAFCFLALAEPLPPQGDKAAWAARNTKVSELWHALTEDEKNVFRNPYFFALAGLPDLSYVVGDNEDEEDNDEENFGLEFLDAATPAPKVHQLTDAERAKYQPLFDRLVNVEKLHLSHGQADPSPSVAKLQEKSYVEVRKAHHEFAVVCQKYHISYYATLASCGGLDGWSLTFSNNPAFASWAGTTAQLPAKFSTYVHGKAVAKEIDEKPVQPSDERKIRLGRLLNEMIDKILPGTKFPKVNDPAGEIKKKCLPVYLNHKPGSRVTKEELVETGHRAAQGALVRKWLLDIEGGLFVVEKIPDAEVEVNKQVKRRKNPTADRKKASRTNIDRAVTRRKGASSSRKQAQPDSDDESVPPTPHDSTSDSDSDIGDRIGSKRTSRRDGSNDESDSNSDSNANDNSRFQTNLAHENSDSEPDEPISKTIPGPQRQRRLPPTSQANSNGPVSDSDPLSLGKGEQPNKRARIE